MTPRTANRLPAALIAIASLFTLLDHQLPRSRVRAAEAPVTFNRQIAPILYNHCSSCHHPGGPGPFSLLSYADEGTAL